MAYVSSKAYLWTGLAGIAIAWAAVCASIALSPQFSWQANALSDLGHSVRSVVAPIFNFGLALGGALLLLYAVGYLLPRARLSGMLMAVAAFALQLVAVFDEVYGRLHFLVSIFFFTMLLAALLAYALERRSRLALTSFLLGISTWILYWAGVYTAGIAVPEAVSALSTSAWIILDSAKALGTSRIKRS